MTIYAEACPKGKPHHFWCIEPSSGRTSIGVCKYCREKREFFNSDSYSNGNWMGTGNSGLGDLRRRGPLANSDNRTAYPE